MTYMVSYCVYTAATVDAYEMRVSDGDARAEAAERLSAALRVLEGEARQTPGIRRSLDTIRRQLSSLAPTVTPRPNARMRAVSARPSGIERTASGANGSTGGEGDTRHLQPSLSAAEASMSGQGASEGDLHFDNHSPNDFGLLDTGAGFHPEAFSWGFGDLLNRSTELQALLGFEGSRILGLDARADDL